jgi:hypothetical protein
VTGLYNDFAMNPQPARKEAESNGKPGLLDFSDAVNGKEFKTGTDGHGRLTIDSILRAHSPGTLSNFSVDDNGHIRLGRQPFPELPSLRPSSTSPSRPHGSPGAFRAFWVKNKGLVCVILSQIFNTMMNVTTRLLEVEGNDGKGFHPIQVIPLLISEANLD